MNKYFTTIFATVVTALTFGTPDLHAAAVNNKTSQFDEVFSELGATSNDTSSTDLAERIRRQRALLDNKANTQADSSSKSSGVTGANACDAALRKCMAEKCGSDFTKCAKDSTAIWGDKMDSCRRKTKCTGHEYALLAPEILADRDFNERMTYYNSVISCGNRYNSCIFTECGATLNKCLSKTDGDRAVSKCASVAKDCEEQDSGLAARVMTVFGDLRTVATAQAEKDEKRLYELRDLMRTQCNRLGAMFDERTLDCVYTVNFFAGDNISTPTSSKKLYAGDSFQCNANWFGVDVTTFKENAYRRTRAQTSASSAMMGAGVGVAAGLVASGAIDRALDTQRAEKAAKEECEKSGFTWEKGTCNKDKPYTGNKNNNDDDDEETGEEVTDDSGNNGQSGNDEGLGIDEQGGNQQEVEAYTACTNSGGIMQDGECLPKEEWLARSNKCVITTNEAECKGNNSCTWDEEVGECSLRSDSAPTPTPNQPESTPQQNDKSAPASTPQDETKPVTLNLTFADKTNTVKLPATIECKYTNKKGKKDSQKKTAKQDGKVTLTEIPLNAECTIAAVNCTSRKVTAKTLDGLKQFVPLKCEIIDKCIADGGKWQKNKCVAGATRTPDSCDLTPKQVCGQGIQHGKCEWKDDKCQDKATPPETSTQNGTGAADDISPVDINITVITSAKTPVTGTLTCETKKPQSKKIDKNGLVALKKIPANTQCTISTSTPTCSPQTITAQELSTMKSITLKCDKVDRCINNGGKWQNNDCTGAAEGIKPISILVETPRINNLSLELTNLKIKCSNPSGTATLNGKNNVLVSKMLPSDTCDISADNCDTYHVSIKQLQDISANKQSIKLKCPEFENCVKNYTWENGKCTKSDTVTLNWSKESRKFVLNDGKKTPKELNRIECGDKTLNATSQTITVNKNTQCKIFFADNTSLKSRSADNLLYTDEILVSAGTSQKKK